jgi:transposase
MVIVPVYVGLDYHSTSIRVCVLTEDGEELFNGNVPNDLTAVFEAVSGVFERKRKSRGRKHVEVDKIVEVRGVSIEACTGSANFAAALERGTSWKVRMAHAASVHRLKQGPDKTDRGDAWHLANLLRVNYLPEVWLADETTRQLRHLVRHRQSLVADIKDVKLRIRSLLKENGVRETCEAGAWTKTWMKWLNEVCLPEHSGWIIQQQLDLLVQLREKIAQVEARMEEATQEDPIVLKLLEETGVGLVTALLLRAVIGRFSRFGKGKQLSRYCGTSPCNASSGKRQADSGLVTAGHDDLRAALVQLAKRLPRLDPHWKEFKERLGKQKAANVVSGAIANRWLRRLFHTMVELEKALCEAGTLPPVTGYMQIGRAELNGFAEIAEETVSQTILWNPES